MAYHEPLDPFNLTAEDRALLETEMALDLEDTGSADRAARLADPDSYYGHPVEPTCHLCGCAMAGEAASVHGRCDDFESYLRELQGQLEAQIVYAS